jgi:hypothetical protein
LRIIKATHVHNKINAKALATSLTYHITVKPSNGKLLSKINMAMTEKIEKRFEVLNNLKTFNLATKENE